MDEVIKITKGSRELYISYGKSFSKGVDPKIKKLEKALDDEELNIRKNKNRKIICIFEEIMKVNLIYNGLIKSGYFFILCDTEGYIIKLIYDDHLANYFKKINLVEGASLRLEDSGTNAINLAMEYRSQVEICGEDHYCELLKNWYCTAMPIINYNDTAIIAYLDMSCVNYSNINNQSLVLKNIVTQIEKYLSLKHEINYVLSKLSYTDKLILSYLARGYTRKSIGTLIHISESSIKRHLYKLYDLFNADNDITLVLNAIKAGIIDMNGNIL